jgi:hypothetical protein
VRRRTGLWKTKGIRTARVSSAKHAAEAERVGALLVALLAIVALAGGLPAVTRAQSAEQTVNDTLAIVNNMILLASAPARASPPSAATPALYLPLVMGPAYTMGLVPIGTPIWKQVDIHLFSAVGGNFADFEATIAALLPPPNNGPGGSPGQPYLPPYDTELAQLIIRSD